MALRIFDHRGTRTIRPFGSGIGVELFVVSNLPLT